MVTTFTWTPRKEPYSADVLPVWTCTSSTASWMGRMLVMASRFELELIPSSVMLFWILRWPAPRKLKPMSLVLPASTPGVVLASDVFESGAAVDRLLFGTLLGLETADLALSAATVALALVASLALGRTWAAIAFDPDAASGLGLPAARADFLLLALVAVAVVAAIPAVGVLLVAAIYVLPAAAARLVARSIPALLAWSLAAIVGPVLVNYTRQGQINAGVPAAQAYSVTMYIMAGLLLVGLVCNLMVREVDAKHHHEEKAAARAAPQRS